MEEYPILEEVLKWLIKKKGGAFWIGKDYWSHEYVLRIYNVVLEVEDLKHLIYLAEKYKHKLYIYEESREDGSTRMAIEFVLGSE